MALCPIGKTFASASGVTVPTDPVAEFSVTDILLLVTRLIVPRAEVPACPVGVTFASPSTKTDTDPKVPTAVGQTATASPFTPTPDIPPVALWPVGVIFAFATTEIVPSADVAALGAVSVTGKGSPQVNCPQVPRPQPLIFAI
jgi:hypothetical protein